MTSALHVVFQMLITHPLILRKIVCPFSNVGVLLKEFNSRVSQNIALFSQNHFLKFFRLYVTEEVHSREKSVRRGGL